MADWNSRGLGTLTAGVTQAIERNLTKETTRKEASMEEVTEEDIAAVRRARLVHSMQPHPGERAVGETAS